MTNPLEFLQEVRAEGAKVTWPTRRETLITTGLVLFMVLLASLFFVTVDWALRLIVTGILSLGHLFPLSMERESPLDKKAAFRPRMILGTRACSRAADTGCCQETTLRKNVRILSYRVKLYHSLCVIRTAPLFAWANRP